MEGYHLREGPALHACPFALHGCSVGIYHQDGPACPDDFGLVTERKSGEDHSRELLSGDNSLQKEKNDTA